MKSLLNTTLLKESSEIQSMRERYPALSLRALLRSWEFYLVIIVGAFLRLYAFHTTEFDDDEAAVFQMAYNAVHHGYLVATGNVASIHVYNPPAVIYLFMLPAAFTDNPLWGAVMVGVLMAISVVLTYLFVRHYYGRVAATIAALTYATTFRAIVYSRFIWNQNLVPLFVILMIMALFHGVVARKRGWLWPALLLLGILIQLHGSGIFMAIPLAVAFVLAPGTVRKRDVVLSAGLLLLIYAPYLVWEFSMHLIDIRLLLHSTSSKAFIDDQALHYFAALLNPYKILSTQSPLHWNIVPFIGEQSYLGELAPYLSWISQLTLGLLVICTVFVLVLALLVKGESKQDVENDLWLRAKQYWQGLRASPDRCGLVVLLSWQIVPLLLLSRHSLTLYLHYLIIFLPGPFILLGIGLSKAAAWLQTRDTRKLAMNLARYGIYALVVLIIAAQGVGSLAGILDLERGHYSDGSPVQNLYNDLRSLKNAIDEADRVAQEHHLNRIYMSTDWPTQSTLRFLSTQMHTPTTLFSDQDCVVLPGPTEGPAVMMVGPYSDFTDALVRQFSSATLVDQPIRPGGAPFRLYIVNTQSLAPVPQAVLGHDLQLLNAPAQPVAFEKNNWLVSQWELVRSAQPGYRQVYGYHMMQRSGEGSQVANTSNCAFTAMRSGDRLLIPLPQSSATPGQQTKVPATISVQANSYEIYPYYLKYGPLTFETYDDITTPTKLLKTGDGGDQLVISVKSGG